MPFQRVTEEAGWINRFSFSSVCNVFFARLAIYSPTAIRKMTSMPTMALGEEGQAPCIAYGTSGFFLSHRSASPGHLHMLKKSCPMISFRKP